MRTYFIGIGSEILARLKPETNSLLVQEMLGLLGQKLTRKIIIPDTPSEMKQCIANSMQEADIIILSGGLGPTVDDLTVNITAEILGYNLVFSEDVWEKISRNLRERGRPVHKGNRKQAYLIEGAVVLDNRVGQAPGQYIKAGNKHLFLLPGVPSEFKGLLNNSVKPVLKDIYPHSEFTTFVFKLANIPESEMDTRIKENLSNVFPLPGEDFIISTHPGEQTLMIITSSNEHKKRKIEIRDALEREFPDNLFAEEDISLEEATANCLIKKKLQISVAESCTGGILSDKLTNTPGSSAYFQSGIVSYSNEAKISFLNVSEETLMEYGAVSKETAKEMCVGLRKKTKADITLSITGIAGPGGGTKEKPVGTVFVGISDKIGTEVQEFHLPGTRRFFKQWISSIALNILRLRVQRYH